MDNINDGSRQPRIPGEKKPFTKKVAEGAKDLLNAGRDLGLLISGAVTLLTFIGVIRSPETLAQWLDAFGNHKSIQNTAPSDTPTGHTRATMKPRRSKTVVIRDTIIKVVKDPPIQLQQKPKDEIVLFKMRNGRKYPFRASRQNDTLQLEDVLPPKIDSVLSLKGSEPAVSSTDITMIGKYSRIWKKHLVRPGDILRRVAKIYGVSKEALMKENNRTRDYAVRGEWLNIPYPEATLSN